MKNKRLLSLVLCICLTASLFVGLAGTAANADGYTNGGYTYVYTVNANGTSVESICKAFGMPYNTCADAIRILNGWSAIPASLNAGTQIVLPNGPTVAAWVKSGAIKINNNVVPTAQPTANPTTNRLLPGDAISYYIVPHTVAAGETLYGICNAMGVSYNTYSNLILNTSGIQTVNNIKAGKVVYIPTLQAPKSGTFYAVVAHKVQSGETLTSICTNYGVKYDSFYQVLAGLNDGLNLNYIKAGNTVYVPTPASYVTPTVPPVKPTPTPVPTAAPTPTPETGYAISFLSADYGTPAASVGGKVVTRADAGKTVTILPNCKAGYAVQSIKVIRADNNSEIPTSNNSFTMPAIGVKITITYAKGEYSINCITTTHGTYNVLVSGTDGDCANYGDEISVVVNADPGFVVDKVTYQKNNNKISAVEVKDENSDGIYKFMMPKYNMNVNVVFKQATFKKLHDAEMKIIGASMLGLPTEQFKVSYEVDGQKISGNLAPVGGIITMKVTVPAGGTVEEILINNDKNIAVTDIGGGAFTFKMPDVESTVTVYVADDSNRSSYKLAVKKHSSTSFIQLSVTDAETGKVSTEAKSAKPGDKVSIVAYPLSKYKYVTSTATGGAFIQNDGSNDYFIMPAGDVTVTPNFVFDGVTKYGLQKVNSNSWSFSAYGNGGVEKYCFEAGEKVTIVAHPAAGKKLSSATYNYTQVYSLWGIYLGESRVNAPATVKNNTFTFTMPAAYVDLTLKFSGSPVEFASITTEAYNEAGVLDPSVGQAYPLVNGGQPSRISTDTWSVPVGSKLTFDIRPATIEGVEYEAKKVQIVNSSLTSKYFGAKTIKPDANGVYAYTVIDGDIELSAGLILKVTYGPKENTAKKYNVLYAAPENEKCMYWFTVEDLEGKEILGKTSGPIMAEAGKFVTVHIPNLKFEGFKFSKLYIDETDRIPEADSGVDEYKYTFLMPEHDVKTEVIFERNDIYKITRLATSNGTFNVQVLDGINPSTAHTGDTVKIMPKPDEGYVVDEAMSSVEYDGTTYAFSAAPINKGTDGAYTFVMPRDDVKINVVYKVGSFKLDASQIKDNVTVNSVVGTSSFDSTTYISKADIPMGTKVELKVEPKAGIAIAEDQVFCNDTRIPLVETAPAEGPYMLKSGSIYTIYFDMPGKDAEIRVGTKGASHNIYKEDPTLFEYCPALEDTGKTVEFALTIPFGKRVSKISYVKVNEDGSEIAGEPDVLLFDAHDEDIQPETARPERPGSYDAVIGKGNIVEMPDSAVKLKVDYEYALQFKYNTQIGDVTANTASYADVKFAKEGDNVTVNAIIKDEYKSDYRIANIRVVFDDETLPATIKVQDITSLGSFTMEASSATVYVDFVLNENRYVIMSPFTGNENVTVKINNNVVSEGKTSYAFAPGTKVTVVVTPDSGYILPNKFDSVAFTPAGLEYTMKMDSSSYVFAFKMPEANDVTFSVEAAERSYKISATVSGGHGELKLLEDPNGNEISGKVFAGATVYARVKPENDKYALQDLYYKDINGKPVYITTKVNEVNGYTYYSFQMPAYDTTVVATFKLKSENRVLNGNVYGVNVTITASGNNFAFGNPLVIGTTANYSIDASTIPTGKTLGMVRVTYTDSNGKSQKKDLGNALTGSFTMPNCKKDTAATFEIELVDAPTTFAVNLGDPAPEGVQVRFSTDGSSTFDTAAKSLADIAAGTTVYVFAKPDENYQVTGVTLSSGTFTPVTGYEPCVGYFSMPSESVFVNVTSAKDAIYNITLDGLCKDAANVDKNTAKSGDMISVTLAADPTPGKVYKWHVDDPLTDETTSGTFTMPAHDVVITVSETDDTPCSVTVDTTSLPGVSAPTTAFEGQTVQLSVDSSLKGQDIQYVVVDAGGNILFTSAVVEAKEGVLDSFTMPGCDVTVKLYNKADHIYNIVFAGETELFDVSTPSTAKYNESVTVNLVSALTGYVNKFEYDGTTYASGDNITMPAHDIQLAARSEKINYTLDSNPSGIPFYSGNDCATAVPSAEIGNTIWLKIVGSSLTIKIGANTIGNYDTSSEYYISDIDGLGNGGWIVPIEINSTLLGYVSGTTITFDIS